MTFLVNDGVIPSNEDRGYVLRRVIRRAVRFAYLLDVHKPVLTDLVGRHHRHDGRRLPRSRSRTATRSSTSSAARRSGSARRSRVASSCSRTRFAQHAEQVPGEVAFQLHDTYGFPLEVTQEIAREQGVDVDVEGFDRLMTEQRERAKAAGKKGDLYADLTDFQSVLDRFGPTDFVGREEFETKATVVAVVPGRDDTVALILDRSPFYAEAGGQVGDTGTITTDTGTAEVLDTNYALPGLHRHVARHHRR